VKFRWKMLILLLTVSLIPLISIAALYYLTTIQLGNRLASDTHRILTETAESFLLKIVDDYGRILNRDKETLELMLTVQAKEISRRLSETPPQSSTIIYSKEYDKGFTPPGGMVLSKKHARVEPSGKRISMPVSYNEQVYFLVKGINKDTVANDMARLSGMPDFYRMIYQSKPSLILWQYIGLESGLQINYPGAGGFPDDFDQRKRQWYLIAKKAGKLVWGPPVVDALTQITVLTLSMPIYQKDGSFAGVTAIDVLVPGIFEELKLPEQWSSRAKMTSVAPVLLDDKGGKKLSIVAQMSYLDLQQDWQMPVELEFLESDDQTQLAALIKDAMDGRSGVRKMEYNGRKSLWAYGVSGAGNTFPVVIVPYDLIIAQATNTKKLVLDITHRELHITGVIFIGVLAMVIFLAVFVSRRVTGPIIQLSKAATKLSMGDYQTQVTIRTGDELQDLGDIFNSLGKELKLRQRQLVQADKMASLGVLVAGVAHEINNPNGLILLNLRQLQRAWVDIGPILEEHFIKHNDFLIGGLDYSEMRHDIPEMLVETKDRAERIKRIVNDLKDFARRDKLTVTRSIDLNEVAKMAIRLVENSLKKVTKRFSVDLEENLPHFMGSAQRIEQIVINLLVNACQILEKDDQGIILRTAFVKKTGEVILEVIDDGPGIDPKHLSMLTDPFFTTRREHGGTGLGLSVSAGIAEEHGGRIEFDSRLGIGTRARLILPQKS